MPALSSVALMGRGWFQVETPDGETVYTRSGAFNKNAQGQLVTIDGYTVVPGITVPQDATEIAFTSSGEMRCACTSMMRVMLLLGL